MGAPVWVAALALAACAPKPAPAPAAPPPPEPSATPPAWARPDAVAGVADPALQDLLHRHWSETLAASPEWATAMGVHDWDDLLDDHGPEARAAARERAGGWLAEARALQQTPLSDADRVTLEMLLFSLQSEVDEEICRFEEWMISPRMNAVGWANNLHHDFPRLSPDDGAALLSRLEAAPGRIDQDLAALRQGLEAGRVANAESVRRTIALVAAELVRPADQLEALAPTRREAPPEGWAEADWAAWTARVDAVVQGELRAAWSRYHAFLESELLPAAREGGEIGMHALPDGAACYAARVRRFTTLPQTAEETHAAGLRAIAANHAEFRALGQRVFGTDDLPTLFERLRTDPALRFETEEEVEQAAQETLDAAKAVMAQSFGRLPEADCAVEPMPAFEAPYSTIAYYRPATPGGEKPGTYVINTYAPETRPRHEARALAVHEAIPGHHLQIAIAQELPEVPAFRRHMGATAFVEGWALYSERLADEQGLYRDDLDRMGMLAFDAWRASRLVVDTGIHHKGWTRAEAVAYMQENTPLALNNIDNEVDRYISWPGQALAYKTGQLEILAMRAQAEEDLGAAFDVRGFHDTVLGGGAVTLPILHQQVRAWVATQRDDTPPPPTPGDAP